MVGLSIEQNVCDALPVGGPGSEQAGVIITDPQTPL